MSKYHAKATYAPFAGVGGIPLCGSRNKDRYNIVTVGPNEWNATSQENKCSKCVEKIRNRKAKQS